MFREYYRYDIYTSFILKLCFFFLSVAVNKLLPPTMRVLARQSLPTNAVEFHAEMCCSQRLYEYIIPLVHLLPQPGDPPGPTREDIIKHLAPQEYRDK